MDTPAVRLAHFSDIHVTVRPLGWALHDLRSKRVSGWFNLKALGRGHNFRHANAVVRALAADLHARRPDHLVFSGDATALGFSRELVHAAELLHVAGRTPSGIAVPGNHDYYTHSTVKTGAFEREFAPWQAGERIGDHIYPFAQRVGHVWLIGVNSSTANRRFWDASGEVGASQRERLRELLDRLGPGPRVLVTHYPVCKGDGPREVRWHGLRDLEETMAVAVAGRVGLWLHGHRHLPYFVDRSKATPIPVICAGSATQTGIGGYGEYVIEGTRLRALRRIYSAVEEGFRDGERFELELTV